MAGLDRCDPNEALYGSLFGQGLGRFTRTKRIALLNEIVNLDILIIRAVRADAGNEDHQQSDKGKKPFHDDAW